jgi:hypothetical protein
LEPFVLILAQHFGVEGRMHSNVQQLKSRLDNHKGPLFEQVYIWGNLGNRRAKSNGRWGHQANQSHCTKHFFCSSGTLVSFVVEQIPPSWGYAFPMQSPTNERTVNCSKLFQSQT